MAWIRPWIHNNFVSCFLADSFTFYFLWSTTTICWVVREVRGSIKRVSTSTHSTIYMEWECIWGEHWPTSLCCLLASTHKRLHRENSVFISLFIFVGCAHIYIVYSSVHFSMLHLNASRSEHTAYNTERRSFKNRIFAWFSMILAFSPHSHLWRVRRCWEKLCLISLHIHSQLIGQSSAERGCTKKRQQKNPRHITHNSNKPDTTNFNI